MGFPEAGSCYGNKVKAAPLSWEATSIESEPNRKGFLENLDQSLSLHVEGLSLSQLNWKTTERYSFGSFETTELEEEPQVIQSCKLEEYEQEKDKTNKLTKENVSLRRLRGDQVDPAQESRTYVGHPADGYEREEPNAEFKKQSSTNNASFMSDSLVSVAERNTLYKTELCRSFMETGFCRYGVKCQFAHGTEELRQVKRHPKYKTRYCRNFMKEGNCPYGSRCRFIHRRRGSFDGLETDLLYAVEGLLPAKRSTSPRSRLPIFQKLQEECAEDIESAE
ncbi:Tristetraprolin [Galdieria sulphuraria]|uniref:Zinc finger protein n=1 Tax=Galdieria sulphuraria TaxID=130081 RepID=M2VUA0_GALSU|nr:zinc finger protein [Galdieria sulphuraria]EME26766.1 zinc finger protein [Galdieria sulphuraria]GJD07040.1 Tristetraprolin [Galdieria sulphuraria]|eukprot:XP_005703286.1 zinc finger protein [Galdieria sulphuraria]